MTHTDTQQTLTTCPYCGVGCGVAITQQDGKLLPVVGDAHHPANVGKLCVKGSSLHETVDHVDRLLHPTLKDGKTIPWDQALNLVSDKMQQVLQTHGPKAVAIYAAGQILTEDYYVANKLMKGFVGSANLDTNSRLCMASAVASYKRALGSDTVPGCYEDLDEADLIVLTGSNAAWAHPILFQRMAAAKEANPNLRIVVIDPRRTATSDLADLHLTIRPGSDGFLFNALLAHLYNAGAVDRDFIHSHTEGFDDTLSQALSEYNGIHSTAELLDIADQDLVAFFEWFTETEKTVTFYSQGINQSGTGTDKGNAIINVHLATGRIGKPGASPFSITGQPNAMGGREVGGLANQLAAHMDFSPEDRNRIRRFWNAPNLVHKPGLKAVDMFDAIKRGEIKFLWVISTNPLVSMPDADDVKAAMEQCELVVLSDCMANTDTAAAAHLLLPASSWGEKNGTVTNSERRISRQRGFLPSPGEARPDWWILTQVARRLGFEEDFPYEHPRDIFDEHARLTSFENEGRRDLDLSGLVGMSPSEYDAMLPIQWPVNREYPNGRQRFFGDGRFYTPNQKARFLTVKARLPEPRLSEPRRVNDMVMNTGRVRDHWHTMTRTAKSALLAQHIREPYVDMHPLDAQACGIQSGQLVEITNERGRLVVRAQLVEEQRRGEIFTPMHWTSRYASQARVGVLIDKTNDPVSGQPELKYTGVSVSPFPTRWRGMLLSREDLGPVPCDYWAYGLTGSCHGYEIAGNDPREALVAWVRTRHSNCEWLHLKDPGTEHERLVGLSDERIEVVLFVHQDDAFRARQWLLEKFRDAVISPEDRGSLLAGRPQEGGEDSGAIVCSCFTVGENTIRDQIRAGAESAEALGEALKCGTNCGSCVPELKGLIRSELATPV